MRLLFPLFILTCRVATFADFQFALQRLDPVLVPYTDLRLSLKEAAYQAFKAFHADRFGPLELVRRPEKGMFPPDNDFGEVSLRAALREFPERFRRSFSKPDPTRYFSETEADTLFDAYKASPGDTHCFAETFRSMDAMPLFDEMWDRFKDLVYRVNRLRQALFFHHEYLNPASSLDPKYFGTGPDTIWAALRARALAAFRPFVICLEKRLSEELYMPTNDGTEPGPDTQLNIGSHFGFLDENALHAAAFYGSAGKRADLWIENAEFYFLDFKEQLGKLTDAQTLVERFHLPLFRTLLARVLQPEEDPTVDEDLAEDPSQPLALFRDFEGLKNRMVGALELGMMAPEELSVFLGKVLEEVDEALQSLAADAPNHTERKHLLSYLKQQLLMAGASRSTLEGQKAVLETFLGFRPLYFPVRLAGRSVLAFCGKGIAFEGRQKVMKDEKLHNSFVFSFEKERYLVTPVGVFRETQTSVVPQLVKDDFVQRLVAWNARTVGVHTAHGVILASEFLKVDTVDRLREYMATQKSLCSEIRPNFRIQHFPWSHLAHTDPTVDAQNTHRIRDEFFPMAPKGLVMDGTAGFPDTTLDRYLELLDEGWTAYALEDGKLPQFFLWFTRFMERYFGVFREAAANYLIFHVVSLNSLDSPTDREVYFDTLADDWDQKGVGYAKLTSPTYRWVLEGLVRGFRIPTGPSGLPTPQAVAKAVSGKACQLQALLYQPPSPTRRIRI